jgi:hypothetical protein
MIGMPNGTKDSYGFWPTGSFIEMLTTGPGRVQHPDTSHTPVAKQTEWISKVELQQGINYAYSKENANYSLLGFNCTDFARGMYEAATGKEAPPAGWFVQSPGDRTESINRPRDRPWEQSRGEYE